MNSRILVLNGMSYAAAIRGLGQITFDDKEFVRNPEKFKLVLFTGGSDVSPYFYGETTPKGICHFNPLRDAHEVKVFKVAEKYGIPMAGICRGIQFLSVMAGGRLMHDISGHAYGEHDMIIGSGEAIRVNSLHHQMVIPHDNAIILGASPKMSRRYIGASDLQIEYYGPEVEAAIFPNIKAFGVQYHPEMMPETSDGYEFFYKMVQTALANWDVFVNVYGVPYDTEICNTHGPAA